MSHWVQRSVAAFAVGLFLAGAAPTAAQELEPRAYRAMPVGLNFVTASYTISSGNVVIDATAPVSDLDLHLNSAVVGYLHSFGLFGRSASVSLAAPYVFGSGSGTVLGVPTEGTRNAWADARVKLAVNLLGGPAMSPAEFAKRPQGRALGVGLAIGLPTGQYGSELIVNFGANRWAFKPEIGYSGVRGRWIFEAALGVWLFTSNHDGPGGATLRQDPIGNVQGHLSYNFDGGVWVSLAANYFTGGQSSINDEDLPNRQSNSRVGATLSLPLAARHSLKFSASTGAYTRIGADFDTGTVMYQFRW